MRAIRLAGFLALAVIATVAVVVVVLRAGSPGRRRPVEAGGDLHAARVERDPNMAALDRLARRLANLEAELAALQRAAADAVVTPADRRVEPALVETTSSEPEERADPDGATLQDIPGRAENGSNPAGRPRSPEQQLAQAQEEVQAIADAYQGAIDEERPDPAWSPDMEDRLAESLRSTPALGGPTIRFMDCRTTMCVVELSFASPAQRDRFWRSAPATPPWNAVGEAFIHAERPDDTEVEVYLTRGGHRFPNVGNVQVAAGPDGGS